jgi:periplasmic protein CpxP/Spy
MEQRFRKKNTKNELGTVMKTIFISAFVYAVIILGVTANITQAQFSSQPPVNMQMPGSIEKIPDINFTDKQKEKLKEIKAEIDDRISKILTSEQQASLKAAVEAEKNPQEAMKSLKLSTKQKKQLEGVQKWQRNQLLSILTSEQKQKVRKMMMQRQGDGTPFGLE